MYRSIYILIFIPGMLCASLRAQDAPALPRDTSFTVWSAFQKIRKDYPHAFPVGMESNPEVNAAWSIPYRYTGTRDLHMDIFWPVEAAGKKHPAVICVHGGGWASGDRSHLVPLAQELAKKGYAAASVEYRLSPEATYPAGVLDVKYAVRWLKTNAKLYHIDTTRIAILGTSAGATIASLVGVTACHPLFREPSAGLSASDRVQAILNIDGVLDFTDPAERGKDTDPLKPSAAARWFGCTFMENPGAWKEASPLNYVNGNTPPTLFINSSLPRFHAGRDEFTGVLENYGTYFEVHTIDNTPHPFWLFHPWYKETIRNIENFLVQVFD